EQSQDVVVSLLPRNAEVPLRRTTDFGTDADNQSAVDIRVMSGERDSTDPLDCQEVGVATLNLPERLPARSPIRVKFAINQDGRLEVSAADLTGGGSIDVNFETEAVMNAEEVAERSTALRLMSVWWAALRADRRKIMDRAARLSPPLPSGRSASGRGTGGSRTRPG